MKIIEVNLPNGYRLKAVEKSKSIINEIWKEKIYEKDFNIEKNMNVLDIGANQGFFSLYAASKGANVIGVEPEEKNFDILNENIKINKLEKQIRVYKYAVSCKEGMINLYSHDFDEEFASGIVTTSKNFLKITKKLNYKKINTQKVNCISLKKLLTMIHFENIDLLKIDCEGAEIDILKSAQKDFYKNINNIVMETHDTYPEKDIFHLIKEIGFNIVSYKKLGGLFNTGYIFAENNKITQKNIYKNPIAIIDIPLFSKVNNKILINGSKSFSAINRNGNLTYNWFINEEKININDSSFEYIFNKTGLHTIQLELTDNNNNNDIIKKNIWILKNKYFNKINNVSVLQKEGEDNIYIINKEKHFSIKIPKTWKLDRLIIGIKYIDSNDYSAHFNFNDNITDLSKEYTEIELYHLPYDLEINFSIYTDNIQNFKINWWAIDNNKFNQSIIAWIRKKNLIKNSI